MNKYLYLYIYNIYTHTYIHIHDWALIGEPVFTYYLALIGEPVFTYYLALIWEPVFTHYLALIGEPALIYSLVLIYYIFTDLLLKGYYGTNIDYLRIYVWYKPIKSFKKHNHKFTKDSYLRPHPPPWPFWDIILTGVGAFYHSTLSIYDPITLFLTTISVFPVVSSQVLSEQGQSRRIPRRAGGLLTWH